MTSTSFLFRPPHMHPDVTKVGIDGDLMACGGRDGHLNLFFLTRGTHILSVEFHSPISALHWDTASSANRINLLFVGMRDGTVEKLGFSITSSERAVMITTASQIIFKDRSTSLFKKYKTYGISYNLISGDLIESKYTAADILDWWIQRKSNADVDSKSSVPPTAAGLSLRMNQTRNEQRNVGVPPEKDVAGVHKEYDRKHDGRREGSKWWRRLVYDKVEGRSDADGSLAITGEQGEDATEPETPRAELRCGGSTSGASQERLPLRRTTRHSLWLGDVRNAKGGHTEHSLISNVVRGLISEKVETVGKGRCGQAVDVMETDIDEGVWKDGAAIDRRVDRDRGTGGKADLEVEEAGMAGEELDDGILPNVRRISREDEGLQAGEGALEDRVERLGEVETKATIGVRGDEVAWILVKRLRTAARLSLNVDLVRERVRRYYSGS
ncbi:hypothetical protein B0H14DRAFT_2580909 [Mycena olivaceomarginata]|nr:hypothetical protein B0H14DRAFT_2580909 [Mycena olivaceomarginata]